MNINLLQGIFSHFKLSLEKDGQPYLDFSTLPSEVFVESSVLIRVQNSTALDFEKIQDVTFQVCLLSLMFDIWQGYILIKIYYLIQ